MNAYTNISRRTAALAAMAASVAIAVFSIIQITDEQSGETTTVGIEHVSLGALTVTLLLLIPAVLYLGRVAQRPRAAAVAVTGQAALAALTIVSNVRGEDASFFAAVAVPSNLMMFGGWVALAIALRRAGHLPRALAVALPLTWFFMFPGSQIGLGVVAAAYWFTLGWLLHHGELPRPAIERTQAAVS